MGRRGRSLCPDPGPPPAPALRRGPPALRPHSALVEVVCEDGMGGLRTGEAQLLWHQAAAVSRSAGRNASQCWRPPPPQCSWDAGRTASAEGPAHRWPSPQCRVPASLALLLGPSGWMGIITKAPVTALWGWAMCLFSAERSRLCGLEGDAGRPIILSCQGETVQ